MDIYSSFLHQLKKTFIFLVNPQAPQTPPVVVVPTATVRGVIGNPVELHCTASGNPTPRLGWVKVGGELPYGKDITLEYTRTIHQPLIKPFKEPIIYIEISFLRLS